MASDIAILEIECIGEKNLKGASGKREKKQLQ